MTNFSWVRAIQCINGLSHPVLLKKYVYINNPVKKTFVSFTSQIRIKDHVLAFNISCQTKRLRYLSNSLEQIYTLNVCSI